MISGSSDLRRIHEYILSIPDPPGNRASPLDIANRRQYRNLCNQLAATIPEIGGWYVWIGLDEGNLKVIYIGQSRSGKNASLRKRISEELADELIALWATVHGEQHIVQELNSKYQGRYETQIMRSVRKQGATHIAWVGQEGVTQEQLNDVENALIERLNPPANRKRRASQHLFDDLASNAVELLKGAILRLAQQEMA
jgi:hypothetical protein